RSQAPFTRPMGDPDEWRPRPGQPRREGEGCVSALKGGGRRSEADVNGVQVGRPATGPPACGPHGLPAVRSPGPTPRSMCPKLCGPPHNGGYVAKLVMWCPSAFLREFRMIGLPLAT